MIADAVLGLVSALLGAILELLPETELDLPSAEDVSSWFGQYAGPADRIAPVYEAMSALKLMLNVYLPVALTYTVTKWIYKHLPVFGKG